MLSPDTDTDALKTGCPDSVSISVFGGYFSYPLHFIEEILLYNQEGQTEIRHKHEKQTSSIWIRLASGEKAAPASKNQSLAASLSTKDAGQLFSILTEDRRKRKWVLTAGGAVS